MLGRMMAVEHAAEDKMAEAERSAEGLVSQSLTAMEDAAQQAKGLSSQTEIMEEFAKPALAVVRDAANAVMDAEAGNIPAAFEQVEDAADKVRLELSHVNRTPTALGPIVPVSASVSETATGLDDESDGSDDESDGSDCEIHFPIFNMQGLTGAGSGKSKVFARASAEQKQHALLLAYSHYPKNRSLKQFKRSKNHSEHEATECFAALNDDQKVFTLLHLPDQTVAQILRRDGISLWNKGMWQVPKHIQKNAIGFLDTRDLIEALKVRSLYKGELDHEGRTGLVDFFLTLSDERRLNVMMAFDDDQKRRVIRGFLTQYESASHAR